MYLFCLATAVPSLADPTQLQAGGQDGAGVVVMECPDSPPLTDSADVAADPAVSARPPGLGNPAVATKLDSQDSATSSTVSDFEQGGAVGELLQELQSMKQLLLQTQQDLATARASLQQQEARMDRVYAKLQGSGLHLPPSAGAGSAHGVEVPPRAASFLNEFHFPGT